MLKIEFHAMGCQMLVAAENESRQAEQRLSDVPGWFADWEQALSRFRPDSELSRLNEQAGASVPVSQVMWEVLQAARRAERESGGLVTPTMLSALESVGYVNSFDNMSDMATATASRPQTTLSTLDAIQFDGLERSVFLPQSMRLDLAGVAKGWVAHQAMEQLRDLGPVLVDAGGDIAISGPLKGEQAWAIGVNDPLQRGDLIEKIYVHQGGVATSGRDYRRWQQDGEWRHHIIDPRSGQPAETDLLSVTVVAETVMEAEMAAKVVLILGSQNGLEWLDQRGTTAGLAVLENGALLGSHRIEGYIRN